MNKKGFTLVELLSVIAILAILVIIALPNVLNMYNNARKSSFITELKSVYTAAEEKWITDSFSGSGTKTYAHCSNGECDNELKLSGRDDLEYYIEFNNKGKIVKYYAKDNSFQYLYEGEGLNKTDINNSEIIAEMESENKLSISCNKVMKGNSLLAFSILNTNECILENNGVNYDSLKKTLIDLSNQGLNYIITDPFSNIRYYSNDIKHNSGKMKNYMRFQDSDKVFRIIGIVDGEVKIIAEDIFGEYELTMSRPPAYASSYVSSEMDHWPTSTIINDLNTTYYNSLSNMEKSAVLMSKWGVNTGGVGGSSNVDAIYLSEREARNSNDPERSMEYKIASMYVSDFFYSGSSDGRSNRWLAFNLNSDYYSSTNSDVVVQTILPLNGHGWIGSRILKSPGVHPVMHISPMTFVMDGDGSKTNPYIIKLDNSIICR